MKNSILSIILLSSAQLFSQTEEAWKTSIENQVKELSEKIAQLNINLADSSKVNIRFTEEFLNQVYALQRQLEDVSYQVYQQTDFPADETSTSDPAVIGEEYEISDESEENPFGGNRGFNFKKNKSPRSIFRLGFGFGFSDVADLTDRTQGVYFPRFNAGKSGFWTWQFLVETRLGRRDTTTQIFGGFNPKKPWQRKDQFKKNKISLLYGLTLDRNRLYESGNAILTTNANQEGIFENFGSEIKRNEIVMHSLNFPLLIQVKSGSNLLFRAGVFGGIRTGVRQTISYSQNDFDFKRIRRDEFDLPKFNYGLMAGLGWEGLYFSGKFNLNPFFNKSKQYDFRLFSYGLTISL